MKEKNLPSGNRDEKEAQTKELIKDVKKWVCREHRNVGYFLHKCL